ncbi:MAG: hypothetical protein J1G01_02715 [Clostridiales bacterium]|nr:hypothetical protein [Clostridiales bacterium]
MDMCGQTNKNPEQLIKQYAAYPTEQVTLVIDGKKYTVTRHFVGDKNVDRVISELAVARANREMGFTDD